MKTRHLLFVAACLTLSVPALGQTTKPADAPAAFERWYSLLIEDQRAGWMHVTQQTEGPRIVSTDTTFITIRRGAMAITLEMASRFVESADGQAIESRTSQKFAAAETITEMKFAADGIDVITTQMGQSRKQRVARPAGDWLTPAAAHRRMEKELASGSKEFELSMMDASLGAQVVTMHCKLQGKEDVEVLGKIVPAIVWEATMTPPGMSAKSYVDERGHDLKSSMTLMPGMTMTVVESDADIAQAKIDPPELLASTLVKPDHAIRDPRKLRAAVYELQFKPGDTATAKPDLPRAGGQRVVWGDADTATVVVNLDEPVAPGKDLPTDANRKSSAMIGSDDLKVRELTTQALKSLPAGATDADKAEALRRFVYQFIEKKDLGVGLATASEVARTAKGDCTEHAVLLAALLRAAGIPSRTVSGLLYVEKFVDQKDIFGYHMWTQAWLTAAPGNEPGAAAAGGRWVDVDAVLKDVPCDATHIALSTSAMSETGMMNDLMKIAPIIGRVSIKVVQPK